jgi:hypothetical protein
MLNVGISKLGKNEQFFFSKTPQTNNSNVSLSVNLIKVK